MSMTVEQVGIETRKLADAVMSQDYMAILGQIGVAHTAFAEFLKGFQGVRGVEGEEQGETVSIQSLDLRQIGDAGDQLFSTCMEASSQVHTNPQTRPMVGADPVGLSPTELIVLIQAAQQFATLIRNWVRRRQQQ